MQTWTTATGALEMWYPAPGVVADRIVGHLDLELARRFTERLTVKMAGGRIHVFSDWERMEGYDSAVRMELTAWALRRRSGFAGIHALVRSRLVAMGLSVANVALGNFMQAYTDRAVFERMCADRVLKARLAAPANNDVRPVGEARVAGRR
jgi:hypothetical protein